MENRNLQDWELEQATGGAGVPENNTEFSFQVTADETAYSLLVKIYQAKPDISENQADWVLNETVQLIQQGQVGTFVARIVCGNITVRVGI